MTVGRFVVIVLVFVAGYAAASTTSNCPKTSEPLDYSQPVKVVLTSNTHDPECVEYIGHRVVVDGQGHDIAPSPKHQDAQIWRVELAGGRVVLFSTRRPFE